MSSASWTPRRRRRSARYLSCSRKREAPSRAPPRACEGWAGRGPYLDSAAVVGAAVGGRHGDQRVRLRPGALQDLEQQLGRLSARGAVLAVDDEERDAGRAEGLRRGAVLPDGGQEAPV